jgi:soluble lytic murein transglycosylase
MAYDQDNPETYSAYTKEAYLHLQKLYQNLREQLQNQATMVPSSSLTAVVEELLTFCNQAQSQLPPNFRWVTLISTGKRLLAHHQDAKAIEAFKLATHAAKEEQRLEANFYLILAYLHQENAAAALKVIEQNNFLTDYVQLNSKYQFWVALTLERNGQKEKALALYEKLVANGPISYYAIVTLAHLYQKYPALAQTYGQKLKQQEQITPLKISAYTPIFQQALRRLQVFLDMGLNLRAFTEMEYLMGMEQDQALNPRQANIDGQVYLKSLISNMSDLLNYKKNYVLAFRLLTNSLENRILNPDVNIIKDLFPTHYLAQIKRLEKEIDPIIILALIRQESAFNPKARSAAGARGLMQLMPQTARNVRAKTKHHQLSDPEINLMIGTKYFKQILEKQNGNLIYALAAYNAGEHRLKEWAEEIFLFNDPVFTIEMIPFEETRVYVKLILRNIFFYSLLFNNMQLENPLEKHLRPMTGELVRTML